ncbi:hypothetical protein [Pseudomonas segetis]|uniref:Uncharacterized protein n=1 Tax=Pseudomonas segetis TaxID=298908 RepID=A0A239JFM6_9PSED|nr:hypothetical protein [Pseudomonas segetis]SNT04093.1 hypothetical protein SAMN05216255_4309 [Pseudomonas segetis]
MNTYRLTHFDLFDPAQQLEAEECPGQLLAFDTIAKQETAAVERPGIHQKIAGVITLVEQLNRQLGGTARQSKAVNRLQP